MAYVPEKGWFWYIPQHDDMVSVGVVAEGKYLSRDGVKSPEGMFKREVEQNAWIKDHLSVGEQVGRYFVTSEFSFHARHCGCEGLLLVGDAFAFLDPIFSSGVMLALKSGVLAGEAVHKALVARNFAPAQFEPYAHNLRRGVENMRKLVYAFYDQEFSFKRVIDKYPDAVGEITDCLSGDVDKDFSDLWRKISEFVPLPEDLPVGTPLSEPERLRNQPIIYPEVLKGVWQRRGVWGAYASPRVVFGVSPNRGFRRDAGKLHAGKREGAPLLPSTRALPRS